MRIGSTEIQQIVETTNIGRMHLYTTIHKALRARMSAVLGALGQMDAGDDQHCREVMSELEQLTLFLHEHLETENTMVHPAIEARNPGSLADILADHAAHAAKIERLRQCAATLPSLTGRDRAAFGLAVYRELSRFVAENLEHMLDEELRNQQLLWSSYSDDELLAIHQSILASIPPEKMALLLPWLISAVSAEERLGMFMGMRATAPAFVFESALNVARCCLADREWAKLSAALGVDTGLKQAA